MKIFSISLLMILLSVSKNEVAGYAIEMNASILMKTDDNNGGSPDNQLSSMETVELTPHAEKHVEKDLNVEECPKDFIKLGDKCYFLSPNEESWSGALKSCQRLGSTLAYPMNSKENSLLVDHLRKHYEKRDWWIGGSDAAKEGTWVWGHDQLPIVYTDWLAGEPNNGGHLGIEEDCVFLGGSYVSTFQWVDTTCTWAHRFICQQ